MKDLTGYFAGYRGFLYTVAFLILASLLNIILDYTLILYAHMGVAGAALATVISQAVSALLCIVYMLRKYPLLRLRKEDWQISTDVYRKLFSTGASMGFMLLRTKSGGGEILQN